MSMARHISMAVILGLSLAICVAWLWLRSHEMQDVEAIPPDTPWQPVLPNWRLSARMVAPSQERPEAIERPLFSPTRRPPSNAIPDQVFDKPHGTEGPASPETAISADGFRLTGVMIANNVRRAYVHTPANPDGIWIAQEGILEGWTINRITPNSILLRNTEREAVIPLYPDATVR